MAKGIFVITGPTATGKTALGVQAAKALDGEVISADAMQLYRGMVIGTAAPTPEETEGSRTTWWAPWTRGRVTPWAVTCRRHPAAPTIS